MFAVNCILLVDLLGSFLLFSREIYLSHNLILHKSSGFNDDCLRFIGQFYTISGRVQEQMVLYIGTNCFVQCEQRSHAKVRNLQNDYGGMPYFHIKCT